MLFQIDLNSVQLVRALNTLASHWFTDEVIFSWFAKDDCERVNDDTVAS